MGDLGGGVVEVLDKEGPEGRGRGGGLEERGVDGAAGVGLVDGEEGDVFAAEEEEAVVGISWRS